MDERSDARRKADSAREPARHDNDLYSWAVEQAALLRAGRIAEADALAIAEELDDVGHEQYDKLESALRVILLHLLKWDFQPERRSRSWRASIAVQRKHVEKILRKNPGLKPLVEEAIVEAYATARIEAGAQTSLPDETFAPDCTYSFATIMERPIAWPSAD
jgi:predicted DNA-binding ribbon-helix-helix protein